MEDINQPRNTIVLLQRSFEFDRGSGGGGEVLNWLVSHFQVVEKQSVCTFIFSNNMKNFQLQLLYLNSCENRLTKVSLIAKELVQCRHSRNNSVIFQPRNNRGSVHPTNQLKVVFA